jgi:hypothetical protein
MTAVILLAWSLFAELIILVSPSPPVFQCGPRRRPGVVSFSRRGVA